MSYSFLKSPLPVLWPAGLPLRLGSVTSKSRRLGCASRDDRLTRAAAWQVRCARREADRLMSGGGLARYARAVTRWQLTQASPEDVRGAWPALARFGGHSLFRVRSSAPPICNSTLLLIACPSQTRFSVSTYYLLGRTGINIRVKQKQLIYVLKWTLSS